MVTPIKERMRKMREQRQAEGMVRVEVVLPRELLERCRLPGETLNACLQRALVLSVSGNNFPAKAYSVPGNNIQRKSIPVPVTRKKVL